MVSDDKNNSMNVMTQSEEEEKCLYAGVEAEYERTTDASFRDSLTGLFNYGFFLEALKRDLKRSKRCGQPFSLAMINIDAFARFNERYGSLIGDKVLKTTASIVTSKIRESDLAARFLGDTFILLLSDTDVENSGDVLRRIKTAIADQFQGKLTVSIGCTSSRDVHDRDELLRKTKTALLSARVSNAEGICIENIHKQPVDTEQLRILIVDDEPRNLKLLETMLRPLDNEVIKAVGGEEALCVVDREQIDLILLDAMMPFVDGFEVCRRLKNSEATRMIPIIMITALDDSESKIRAIEAGADDFVTKPANRVELIARVRALGRTKRLNDNLVSVEKVLFSLASAVEAKDAYTEGHTKRVSNLAVQLGRMIGLPSVDMEALRIGGMLHDIGKIGIPDAVLNKPGPLDPDEWETMKTHADIGHRMAEPLKSILKGALDVIRHHHEKLDGSGYPDGIGGEELPMVARVMAVVDIYDALVTDRPYRKGMAKNVALEILHQNAAEGLLDRTVVANLISLVSGRNENGRGEIV
jgi:putative two-component system response regulator